ncbi:PD-(D/E)XK nuclease family protein [Vaginella massiliensis]|uniref:PD-(D/E)XK nuclease family protein n=1 Tax=Vaginella massiliensis TaxID=1816680 RepID=UPI000838F40F|nr:PD-(D/E)XK nuclease family protein [Vaginella massiliensis]
MSAFIQKLVKTLLQNPKNLMHTTLVLPGKRPMLFIKQEFQRQQTGIVLPKMISIEDFVAEMGKVQLISGLPLWFRAYKSYKTCFPEGDSFDDFIKWIPTLLKDFDDIDSTLLQPNLFFDYLVSIERIKNWGVEQEAVEQNPIMKNHLEFWKMVKLFYSQFKSDLLAQKTAYHGLANRLAVENLPAFMAQNTQNFVFAGFNALTLAEEKILLGLVKEKQAQIFWDCDAYFLQEAQESGTFLRRYKARLADWNWTFEDFEKPKEIEVTGISKQVGQAKYISQLLSEKSEDELKKTALILADEALLPAVLNALPANIQHVNISMGIPLKTVPLAQFFKSVFELQMNREKLGKYKAFYFKNIVQILENSSLKTFQQKVDRELILRIQSNNRIFNSPQFLLDNLNGSFFQNLFQIPNSPKHFVDIVLTFTQNLLQNTDKTNALMREHLFYFEKVFAQLSNEIQVLETVTNYRTLYLLYQKLIQTENLSFIGEPLEGLQIMGLLETRLINFEHIILTSVNEDVLPLGRQNNTFIPYDIRKEKGLNTFSDNDAIYAYHFYRLLSRASRVNLIYNTDPDGLGAGDKSRFIEQMHFESPHRLNFGFAKPHFELVPKKLFQIQKTPKTLEVLNNWACNTGITPTALGLYLRNPIEFYEKIVLGVNDVEEAEEDISTKTMGNIVHKTLEDLYKPYIGRQLHANDFKEMHARKVKLLEDNFKLEYKEGEIDRGQNLLIKRIVLRIIEGVLFRDEETAKSNELIVLALEKRLELIIDLDETPIKLKGFVDRIDSVNGLKRIIDYKTGNVQTDGKDLQITLEKLEDVFSDKKNAKALQLLFYAHLYLRQEEHEKQAIQLCIYPLKYPNLDLLKFAIDKVDKVDFGIIEQTQELLENLIREILHPAIPFEENSK